MQLHARCGGCQGTVQVDYKGWETVSDLKERLLGPDSAHLASDLRIVNDGRSCPDHARLAFAGIFPSSHVDVALRARGGGGDGGSTGAESRSSYLEMYAQKKPDKVNPEEEKLARWTTCRLSGECLTPPVCADEMGSLYNKSAVVAGLLSKSLPPSLAHISSLRHLIDLKLEPSQQSGQEATKSGATAGSFQMNNGASFACPVTGLPMNGRYRFSALKKSGHVISEKALKEVPAAVEELVGGKWVQEDVLPLNGTPEEVQQLREHVLLQRAAAKAKKERKKAGKLQAALGDIVAGATCVVPLEHDQAADAAGSIGTAGRKRSDTEVGSLAEEKAQVKKFKATETAPKLASKKVWASIFTSSRPEEKETYGCRALSSRGLA